MLYDKRWEDTVAQPVDEVGKLLLEAVDLLERDGWIQSCFYREGRRCALGALERNEGGCRNSSPFFGAAVFRLCEHLGVPPGGSSIVEWNDTPGQTQDKVVVAMRAAAILVER